MGTRVQKHGAVVPYLRDHLFVTLQLAPRFLILSLDSGGKRFPKSFPVYLFCSGALAPLKGVSKVRVTSGRICRVLVVLSSIAIASGPFLPSAFAGRLDQESNYPNIVAPEVEFGAYGVGLGQIIMPRGVAFGPDRRAYVSDCATHQIQVFSAQGIPLGVWGAYGSGAGEFICPAGIGVHPDGTVFVVDMGNNRIQVFRPDGTFVRSFGNTPGAAALNMPRAIAVDRTRVYVANTSGSRIHIYSVSGKFLLAFGASGSAPGLFARPHGVTVDTAGSIYVADMYNNRIQKFSRMGRFLKSWGKLGSFNGDLAAPADVAFIFPNEIAVADSVNHRIQVFSTGGKYLYQFGRHPEENRVHEGKGRVHYPLFMAATLDGSHLVVCEKFESRCQVFSPAKARGSYKDLNQHAWWEKYPFFHYRSSIEMILSSSKRERPFDIAVMSEEELHRVILLELRPEGPRTIRVIGKYGNSPGQFNMANGATIDGDDRLWVSDTLNHRLQVFTLEGKLVRVIGARGSGPAHFNEPGAILVDGRGEVFVADAGNNRVQVLDSNGKFLREWGGYGTQNGQLIHPIYLEMDPSEERIYVLDITPRIQVFDRQGRFLFKWGSYGLGPGQFKSPLKIASGRDSMIYVTDEALNRVTKFTPDGKFVTMWGKHGSGPGEFYLPNGIGVDSQNRVWVVDYGNHRGQTFTADGKFLFMWGERIIRQPDLATEAVPDVVRLGGLGALIGAGMLYAGIIIKRRRNGNGNGTNGNGR